MPEAYGFDDAGVKRVVAVVRKVEGKRPRPENVPPSRVLDPLVSMKVQSVADDHLVCRLWDGTTLGTNDIKVAKPFALRKKPFFPVNTTGDGATYSNYTATTRRKTKGAIVEDQQITRDYFSGDIIYVTFGISGGSGVILNPGAANEERINAIDRNLDGRVFATLGCVNPA
jgi:hypothetical protein